ncbi:MAG: radical SAM family heme chaperone HemW [Hungatella sp.]
MRQPLELYIHIPFCAEKCAYCDFLSAPAHERVRHAYVEQLIEEIRMQSASYEQYGVTTVFIGGGTPSVLQEEDMAQILAQLHDCFAIDSKAEITIEINPGTVNAGKLEVYQAGGINRISIGLQSADDRELKTLGRIHTYDEFLKTYERVRIAGFTNVSVDLMSALPGQTLASWKSTLRKVLMLKPEHISAYSLIIEEGTPFYERYHDHPELLPGEKEEREIYYATGKLLKEQGYERYEISNYAKPGYECRHNIGYWTGIPYLGLGLGASSYVEGCRFQCESDLKRYQAIRMRETLAEEKLHPEREELSQKARMEEFMFLGLRLIKGVSGYEFMERFGQNMWNIYGEVLHRLEANHLIYVESPYVRLTDFGIDISNYVLSEFLL